MDRRNETTTGSKGAATNVPGMVTGLFNDRESAERAYEAVSRVWKPDATWHAFIAAQLERNGIAFRPY